MYDNPSYAVIKQHGIFANEKIRWHSGESKFHLAVDCLVRIELHQLSGVNVLANSPLSGSLSRSLS